MDGTGIPCRRNPPTCLKSLTNYIGQCCIEYTLPWARFELTTLVVIGTDCTDKSNYHTITMTTTTSFHAFILHFYRSVPKYDVTEEELMNDIESHYYWYKRKRKWRVNSGKLHYVTCLLINGDWKQYKMTEMLIIMYLSETTKRMLNICMNH